MVTLSLFFKEKPITSCSKMRIENALCALVVSAIICFTFAGTSHAAGYQNIEADGEAVPEIFFIGYENEQLNEKQRCSPTSDLYVRDRVLEHILIRNLGRSSNTQRNDVRINAENELKELYDSLSENSNEDFRAAIAIQLLIAESAGYDAIDPGKIGADEIFEEYKKLVAANDPLVVKLKLLNLSTLHFHSKAAAKKYKLMLAEGTDIQQVLSIAEKAGDYKNYYEPVNRWIRFEKDIYATPQPDYADNELIGPVKDRGYWAIHHVGATKRVPIALLSDSANLKNRTIRTVLYNKLIQKSKSASMVALFADAQITQNGKPIKFKPDYPPCP